MKICNQGCVCLAINLPCTDVSKYKNSNSGNRDDKNDCNDLVEEEQKNAYYNKQYSDDSEREYISLIQFYFLFLYLFIYLFFFHLCKIFHHVQASTYCSTLQHFKFYHYEGGYSKIFANFLLVSSNNIF